MSLAGYTLNGVALFGLILVVGIGVDDAIVVIENIYRYIEAGESPKVAAIRGAEEVGWPVVAASLTTICGFGPLIFMSGPSGQFMRVVPITVILVLLASLFEVFVILPAHVAEWGKAEKPESTHQEDGLNASETDIRESSKEHSDGDMCLSEARSLSGRLCV